MYKHLFNKAGIADNKRAIHIYIKVLNHIFTSAHKMYYNYIIIYYIIH